MRNLTAQPAAAFALQPSETAAGSFASSDRPDNSAAPITRSIAAIYFPTGGAELLLTEQSFGGGDLK
jgi:hypothetical protein